MNGQITEGVLSVVYDMAIRIRQNSCLVRREANAAPHGRTSSTRCVGGVIRSIPAIDLRFGSLEAANCQNHW